MAGALGGDDGMATGTNHLLSTVGMRRRKTGDNRRGIIVTVFVPQIIGNKGDNGNHQGESQAGAKYPFFSF